MSWRRLEGVFSINNFSIFHFSRRLRKTCLQDVLEGKKMLLWSHLQQVFNTSSPSRMFAGRPLIFKFHQKVLKFNNICVSWGLPKSDLETDFLDLKKSFKTSVLLNGSYSSKYLTFLYTTTYLFLYLILETSNKTTQV